MGKHLQVTELTKKKFIEVFCELYQHKPIEKITVQELTNESGYNRSTFYQYFHDIYDLLEYLENDVLEYLKHTASSNLKNLHNQDFVIQNIAQLYDEKGAYLIALLGNYGNVRFINKLTTVLEKYTTSLDLSHIDEELIPYIKHFFLFTPISMFRCWHANNKNISSEQLVSLIHRLISREVLLHTKEVLTKAIDDNI